jgi:hypothetical protein
MTSLRRRTHLVKLSCWGGAILVVGCGLIADVHDRKLGSAQGGGGIGGQAGGGMAGQGGEAGGPECAPGETAPCYEGRSGTRDVGLCTVGERSCQGGSFGVCEGQVLPTPEVCDSPNDHDCDGSPTCQGHWLLSRRFGDGGEQLSRGGVVDSQGRLVIAGVFEGQIDFDGHVVTSEGGNDLFVAKLDSDGTAIWAARIGDAANQLEVPIELAIDHQDNVYLYGVMVGSFTIGNDTYAADGADGFIASFDGDGNPRWGRLIGGSGNQRLRGLAVDPANDEIVVAGFYTDSFSFDGEPHLTVGNRRIFVGRLSPSGDWIWSKDYGNDTDLTNVFDLAIANNGDIVMVGDMQGSTSFGGPLLINPGVPEQTWLARFDALGTPIWSHAWGTSGDTSARTVAIGADGQLVIGGLIQSNGSVDFGLGTGLLDPMAANGGFVASFDGDGMATAAVAYDEIDNLPALDIDASGFVTVGLRYLAATNLGGRMVGHQGVTDAAILKLTPSLEPVWQHHDGDSGFEDVKGVPMDAAGRTWAVGSFEGTIHLDGRTRLTSAGQGDLFVVRYGP